MKTISIRKHSKIDDLTLTLEPGPKATSVRSLANSTFIYSEQDDIYTDYIYNRGSRSESEAVDYDKINELITNDPTLVDSFISKDSKASAIVVNTTLDQDSSNARSARFH